MKVFFKKYADNLNRNSVSYKLRQKRFNSFIEILFVAKSDKILDVGGIESTWTGTGYEKNVTLLTWLQ